MRLLYLTYEFNIPAMRLTLNVFLMMIHMRYSYSSYCRWEFLVMVIPMAKRKALAC